MPVPKKRKSPARRDRRRANHDRIVLPPLTYCTNPECGAPVLPHHVCPDCGQYMGESVIKVVSVEEVEAKRKERREKAKASKADRAMAARGGRRPPGPAPAKTEEGEAGEDDEDEEKKR